MAGKLTSNEIKQHIKLSVPVYVFDSIDSTNAVASGMAADGAVHGTAVFARHQTRGRGRLGRTFASPDNSGIYMSIILEPATSNPVLITTAAAVAVCRALETVCGEDPQIKWVNDIYINSKKVCGILAEAVTDHKTGTITHIILGIGLNCNASMIPDELSQIAGAVEGDYSINQLAAEILNQLLPLAETADSSSFIDYYKQHSMVLGKTISVYKGGYSPDAIGQPARALDIDPNGGLLVLYSDGSQETLSTGEISIRL